MILDLVQTIAIINLQNNEKTNPIFISSTGFLKDDGTTEVYQANKLHSINLQLQDQRCFSLYGVHYKDLNKAFGIIDAKCTRLYDLINSNKMIVYLAENQIKNPKKLITTTDKIIKSILILIPLVFLNLIYYTKYTSLIAWIDSLFILSVLFIFCIVKNTRQYTVDEVKQLVEMNNFYFEELSKEKIVRDSLKDKIANLLVEGEYIVCDKRF
jgi:hypothetical protein